MRPRRSTILFVACGALGGCGILSGLDDLQVGDAGVDAAGGAAAVTSTASGPASSSASAGMGGGGAASASSSATTGGGGQGGAAESYASLVLSDDPIGYWRFGETPGSIQAKDQSPHHLDGNYLGQVTLDQPGAIAGDPDKALLLDGPDGCDPTMGQQNIGVEVPDPGGLLVLGGKVPFTFEAWVKPSCSGLDNLHILDKRDSAATPTAGYQLFFSEGEITLQRWTPTDHDWHHSISTLGTAKFYHVVATWDGTDLLYYFDGTPVTPNVYKIVDMGPSTLPLRIGVSRNGNFPFAGVLDEVAIYGAALPADRVLAHYEKGVPR